METNAMNAPVTAEDPRASRTASMSMDDGSLVVADRDNEDAWIAAGNPMNTRA